MPAKSAVSLAAGDTARPAVTALVRSPAWAYVDGLLGAIYEGPLESPPWSGVLRMLRDSLRAEHVTLMLRPPSAESSGVMISTGSTTVEATQSYETHFFALDPFVRLEEGVVVSAEELIGRQWLESAVY